MSDGKKAAADSENEFRQQSMLENFKSKDPGIVLKRVLMAAAGLQTFKDSDPPLTRRQHFLTGDALNELNKILEREPGVARLDIVEHLKRQRSWSEQTFGFGPRTASLLDHLQKELKEVAENPRDMDQWIDLVLLALDGALRTGHRPEDVAACIFHSQVRNEGRRWIISDPNKAIEHEEEDEESN